MFACPIFYSMATVRPDIKWIVTLNPLVSQFEIFRYAVLGSGEISATQLAYSGIFMVTLVGFGILLFNKMGDKLIDVI